MHIWIIHYLWHKGNYHDTYHPTSYDMESLCNMCVIVIIYSFSFIFLQILWSTRMEIKYLKSISERVHWKYATLDFQLFYPSNFVKILNNAVILAKEVCNMETDDFAIIMQSCESLIFHEKSLKIKDTEEDFHGPLGCFDGAQIYLNSFVL